MKRFWCVPLLTATLLTGCGDSSKKPAEPAAENPPGASVDYLGALVRGKQLAEKTVDLTTLNHAIQMFQVDQGRWPKDLNELVSGKFIPRLPEPPFGKKFDYDPKTGTVKVVAK